jgi:FkbM family methyltransferase
MSLLANINRLVHTPQMPSAYLDWCFHSLAGKTPHRIIDRQFPNVSIGGWISFSEYWSYYQVPSNAELQFVRNCLSDASSESVLFDVGANIGIFTCWLAALGGSVHSFEPIPETFCRLRMNVKRNPGLSNVKLNCMAVGSDSSLLQFEVRDDSPGTNHISVNSSNQGSYVPSISLDEYCDQLGISSVDFLKIDVEGMEPNVLIGASDLMKNQSIRAILLEVCPSNLYQVSSSPAYLYETLRQNGYTPFQINPNGCIGRSLDCSDLEAIQYDNVACIPFAQ